ncbi:FACT complex subunit spt16 [Puccinia graminis f. sp. tritici]|uniref:FACT complex subunit n=1 Tax=Puccinia graminis f. sp. tritici TaxID=56615 RepID=A0A5B0N681_PUCGR|nr:FACT complex subunit spt16 [Puccinia graminis f. sp. tritici]KAA1093248.1 FACT complex subunit spt16 [Puccinia graminis f. sp. tritici]
MWPNSRVEGGLDVQFFHSRIESFIKSWKSADGPETENLQSCGGILMGEGSLRSGNRPLHVFLFGDVLIGSLIFITPTTVTFFCSTRQAEILTPLTKLHCNEFDSSDGLNIDVRVIVRSPDPKKGESWMRHLLACVEAVISNSERIGCMSQDKSLGGWLAFLKSEGKYALYQEAAIISDEVSVILAIQHPQEIKRTEIACQMSHQLMSGLFDQIISLVKSDREITNEEVGQLIRAKHLNGNMWEGATFEPNFDREDACLRSFPVVRSNGKYSFRKSDPHAAERLGNTGVFLTGLGIQYKSYCSYIRRTLMVDPHPTQQDNYSYLLELRGFALGQLKEGVTGHQIYTSIKKKVKVDRPGIRLPNSFGSSLGVDPHNPLLNLNRQCFSVLKRNMVFSLSLGFLDIEDPFNTEKTYSLHIADTVRIGKTRAKILCDGLKLSSEITFFLNTDPLEFDRVKGEEVGHDSGEEESIEGSDILSKRSGSFDEEWDNAKRQKLAPASAPSSDEPDCMYTHSEGDVDIKPRATNEDSVARNLVGVVNAQGQARRTIKREAPDVDQRLDVLKHAEESMMKGLGDIENKLNNFKTQVKQNFAELRKWAATDNRTEPERRTLKIEEESTTKNSETFQETGKLE